MTPPVTPLRGAHRVRVSPDLYKAFAAMLGPRTAENGALDPGLVVELDHGLRETAVFTDAHGDVVGVYALGMLYWVPDALRRQARGVRMLRQRR